MPPGSITRQANAATNAFGNRSRARRWRHVRDALWGLLDELLPEGSAVAVVGAGNGDDVPLARIARRAAALDLFDLDDDALARARARVPRRHRPHVRPLVHDATMGAADCVLEAVAAGDEPPARLPVAGGAPGPGGYDVVIGDMLYTQLLYPGLAHLGVPAARRSELLARYEPQLTRQVVRRLHASAGPSGVVVHVHDLACWSPRHAQPLPLQQVLANPVRLSPRLLRQVANDPQRQLQAVGARIERIAWWEWPASADTSYLVRATVASGPPSD